MSAFRTIQRIFLVSFLSEFTVSWINWQFDIEHDIMLENAVLKPPQALGLSQSFWVFRLDWAFITFFFDEIRFFLHFEKMNGTLIGLVISAILTWLAKNWHVALTRTKTLIWAWWFKAKLFDAWWRRCCFLYFRFYRKSEIMFPNWHVTSFAFLRHVTCYC